MRRLCALPLVLVLTATAPWATLARAEPPPAAPAAPGAAPPRPVLSGLRSLSLL